MGGWARVIVHSDSEALTLANVGVGGASSGRFTSLKVCFLDFAMARRY